MRTRSHGRRPSGRVTAALVLTILVVLAGTVVSRWRAAPPSELVTATLRLVPAVGTRGSGTCTDPVGAHQWRVTWRAVAAGPGAGKTSGVLPAGSPAARLAARAGAVSLVPTGLTSRRVDRSGAPAGRWRDRGREIWQLRWTPSNPQAGTGVDVWDRFGTLTTLATLPQRVGQSPRYVTPDGSCTVYLAPFMAGTASTGVTSEDANTVAVVGDSLLAQISLPQAVTGSPFGTDLLLSRLAAGHRVQIDGQPGRRWTRREELRGLDAAETSMLDELRGLRRARAVVVALGTNDAGWAAMAADQAEYDRRRRYVRRGRVPAGEALRPRGGCTVLTTIAVRAKTYSGSAPGRFEAAAGAVNAELRRAANRSGTDGLRLLDWAGEADRHTTGDADPWFGPDTIHFAPAGLAPYADLLTRAAALC